MKLKSLLLGSAAALALSTGAQAADPIGTIVSLDACDMLGITGLTLSSDDTCLRISGDVRYEFRAGDYGPGEPWYFVYGDAQGPYVPGATNEGVDSEDGIGDWRSRLEWNLRFAATTATDNGPAYAVIRLRDRQRSGGGVDFGDTGHAVRAQEAYVGFGDTTVIQAGFKPTILRTNRDEPYNYLGLFNSSKVDLGVDWKYGDLVREGNAGISVTQNFGDGFSASLAVENISRYVGFQNDVISDANAGTLVGVIAADGAWGGAHIGMMVDDMFNGFDDATWAMHSAAEVLLDQFALRAALAANSSEYWNGLVTGRGTFDLFTIAASAEFVSLGAGNPNNTTGRDVFGVGFGGSVGANITEDVAINLGARYWDEDTDLSNNEVWQAAIQVVASISDTMSVNAAVGFRGADRLPDDGAFYTDLGVSYAPGGGFTTNAGIELNTYGAYKIKFDAAKSF